MPIYAYKCSSCGHAADVLQKMSAEPLTDCPACGAATYSKQVTAAGFALKGSGWYVTDFRGGKQEGKPEDKHDGKKEGALERKQDSKDAGASAVVPAPVAGASSGESKPSLATPTAPAAAPSPSVAAAPSTAPATKS